MKPRDIFWTILTDNFPLLDECQTLSANVLALLPYERAHDDSNVSIIMIPNTTTWVLSHLTLKAALNSTDSNEVLTSKSHRIYRFCDQPPSRGSRSLNQMEVAKSSGFPLGIATRWSLKAIFAEVHWVLWLRRSLFNYIRAVIRGR